MRNFTKTKLLLIMGIVVTSIMAGCENKENDNIVPQIEPVKQLESSANTENDDISNQNNTESGETVELDGDVVSIGESSVIVSKIFIEPSAFGNGEVMLIGVGGDNQELINVYFEEDASFVYETIRNGGKDVETREGSFLDITEEVMLHMTGRYKGEDFWAEHVDISYVVLSDAW